MRKCCQQTLKQAASIVGRQIEKSISSNYSKIVLRYLIDARDNILKLNG